MTGDPGVDGGLFAPIVTTDALLEATSGAAWVQAMLDAEAALASAEEAAGLIPPGAAAAIAAACRAEFFDASALGRSARLGGNPVIPLVAELRARVGGPASDWVHWGATSQDILDTASMLVAARASTLIETELTGLCDASAALAERHRSTLMAGRTLLQQALPITFGLKTAGWLSAAVEGRSMLRAIRARLPVQLGGAAGTLASLEGRGVEVMEAMAAELELSAPALPWHADRVVVAEVAAVLGMLAGIAAKIARDVALMMQTEVGEAFEPAAPGRGGSSTLPQKRNPVGAQRRVGRTPPRQRPRRRRARGHGQRTRTGGRRLAGRVGDAERPVAPVGGAVGHVRETVAGLEVDADAMATNLGLTEGVLLSERIVLALVPAIGRAQATTSVQERGRPRRGLGPHLCRGARGRAVGRRPSRRRRARAAARPRGVPRLGGGVHRPRARGVPEELTWRPSNTTACASPTGSRGRRMRPPSCSRTRSVPPPRCGTTRCQCSLSGSGSSATTTAATGTRAPPPGPTRSSCWRSTRWRCSTTSESRRRRSAGAPSGGRWPCGSPPTHRSGSSGSWSVAAPRATGRPSPGGSGPRWCARTARLALARHPHGPLVHAGCEGRRRPAGPDRVHAAHGRRRGLRGVL